MATVGMSVYKRGIYDLHLTRYTAVLSDPISFKSKGRDPLDDTSSRKESSSWPEIGKRNTGVSAILERTAVLANDDMSAWCRFFQLVIVLLVSRMKHETSPEMMMLLVLYAAPGSEH